MSFFLSAPQSDVVHGLYRAHHGWLYAWLRKKLNCSHNAADIAHDTFVRVMASQELATLDEPRAYLTRTATRLIIDDARRKRIEALYLAELQHHVDDAQLYPSAEQLLSVMHTLERIVVVLESLADKPRQAFLLHQLEGLGQEEIAQRLQVSSRMVRKYLVQTLVHCHQVLESAD